MRFFMSGTIVAIEEYRMLGRYWLRKRVISMSTTMQCIFCDSVFPCYGGWYEHIMEHLRSEAEIILSKVYWNLVCLSL